ncbi:MAG: chloride channel protein, partial [Burkholderiales bacterium]|nr:chloride channel protein [Burkholderiales bacterium]
MGGRTVLIVALALFVGAVSAFVAQALLALIGLVTNLVFYQRVATVLVAPGAIHHPAWLVVGAPVLGGLVVGLMARYGSEAIRGHGMPEAIEAILRGGSKIRPRVALLKPLSAALTIGTGGPFGAEGPIIMTGGAVGSLIAQTLSLTADERKTLLVAGAAAGMAATFNAPLASILLAVELLLFEFRPRSFVPVAAAVAVATALRWHLLGPNAIFPNPHALPPLGAGVLALCAVAGLVGGFVAWLATTLVYLAEDAFKHLPLHWMWWPAIGGLIIGIGGLFEPRALGVGYDVIGDLLHQHIFWEAAIGILVVKAIIWVVALGSGTSGGVLAPLLMLGAGLGAVLGHVLPGGDPALWPLVCMSATLGATLGAPLTAIVFAFGLTHDSNALLPLLAATLIAHSFATVVMKRSIMTEKIARRGYH